MNKSTPRKAWWNKKSLKDFHCTVSKLPSQLNRLPLLQPILNNFTEIVWHKETCQSSSQSSNFNCWLNQFPVDCAPHSFSVFNIIFQDLYAFSFVKTSSKLQKRSPGLIIKQKLDYQLTENVLSVTNFLNEVLSPCAREVFICGTHNLINWHNT